jgi:hypothetical protein
VTTLDPERAYLAVLAFLRDYYERAGAPDAIGAFLGFSGYTPGEGTADPAIWTDWLAAIHQVQTGEVLSDAASNALSADSVRSMDTEQAYRAMIVFLEAYWNRVSRPEELGELLGLMRSRSRLWRDWLTSIEKIQASLKA